MTRSEASTPLHPYVFGLAFGAAAIWLGLGLGAGGHGWIASAFASFPLALLYPLTMARALSGRRNVRLDTCLLASAILLDVLLVSFTMLYERRQIALVWQLGPGPCILWMALWIGWQAIAVRTFFRRSEPGLPA